MNLFFRVLLAIYAFFLTIISFIALLIPLKSSLLDSIYTFLSEVVLRSSSGQYGMLLISFVFVVLSIAFLMSGFKSDKDKKAVNKHTNIGEIKISLNTIENIALAASRKLNGVRESKASVMKKLDSVVISIKLVVMPDINIPALSEDIQVRVKSSVEESSGIKVDEVKVVVDNVYSGYKSRVE